MSSLKRFLSRLTPLSIKRASDNFLGLRSFCYGMVDSLSFGKVFEFEANFSNVLTLLVRMESFFLLFGT